MYHRTVSPAGLPPLPDPASQPTMSVEEAGKYLGLARSSAYQAVRRGDIPVIKMGTRGYVVPVATFRRWLGLDACEHSGGTR